MAANTKMPLTNMADGYLCEGIDIKGGYFVIDSIENIPSTITVKGSLCYVIDNGFYRYNGSSWERAQFEASVINITDGETEAVSQVPVYVKRNTTNIPRDGLVFIIEN